MRNTQHALYYYRGMSYCKEIIFAKKKKTKPSNRLEPRTKTSNFVYMFANIES